MTKINYYPSGVADPGQGGPTADPQPITTRRMTGWTSVQPPVLNASSTVGLLRSSHHALDYDFVFPQVPQREMTQGAAAATAAATAAASAAMAATAMTTASVLRTASGWRRMQLSLRRQAGSASQQEGEGRSDQRWQLPPHRPTNVTRQAGCRVQCYEVVQIISRTTAPSL